MSLARINVYMREAPEKQPERQDYIIEKVFPLMDDLHEEGYSIEWDVDKKRYVARKVEGAWKYVTKSVRPLGRVL